jgi:hypothetical protein
MAGEFGMPGPSEESVPVAVPDHLTQLLQCPGSARMSRDVVVDQSAAAMLNYHKHIQQTKGRGNGNEEIAGNEPLSVQAQESRPAQITSRPTSRTPGKILVHGPWRHRKSDRSAWPDRSVEASRRARCGAQAVDARTDSRLGSTGSIERRAAATAAFQPPARSESPRP